MNVQDAREEKKGGKGCLFHSLNSNQEARSRFTASGCCLSDYFLGKGQVIADFDQRPIFRILIIEMRFAFHAHGHSIMLLFEPESFHANEKIFLQ
jgi:hypothetical protein